MRLYFIVLYSNKAFNTYFGDIQITQLSPLQIYITKDSLSTCINMTVENLSSCRASGQITPDFAFYYG